MSEKDLLDDLTPDQVEALKTIDFDTVKRHFANKVYKQAANITAEIRRDQIIKGAGKYPEPLNPDSWSAEQLIRHGLEENIDQQHYLVALLDKVEKMEITINFLVGQLDLIANASKPIKKEMLQDTAKTAIDVVKSQKGLLIDAKA